MSSRKIIQTILRTHPEISKVVPVNAADSVIAQTIGIIWIVVEADKGSTFRVESGYSALFGPEPQVPILIFCDGRDVIQICFGFETQTTAECHKVEIPLCNRSLWPPRPCRSQLTDIGWLVGSFSGFSRGAFCLISNASGFDHSQVIPQVILSDKEEKTSLTFLHGQVFV